MDAMKVCTITTDNGHCTLILGDEQGFRYAHVCARCVDRLHVGDKITLHWTSADFDYCEVCGNYTSTVTLVVVLRTTPWECTREPKDPDLSSNGGDYWYWVAEGIVLGPAYADDYAHVISSIATFSSRRHQPMMSNATPGAQGCDL